MKSDLSRTPFSRFGSYLTLVERRPGEHGQADAQSPGVWVSGVHGFHASRDTFRISLWDADQELPFTIEMAPTLLTLRARTGCVEICLPTPGMVRMRCRGVTLRLMLQDAPFNYVVPLDESRWLVNTASAYQMCTVDPLAGHFSVEGERNQSHATGITLALEPHADAAGDMTLQFHVGFSGPPTVTEAFDESVARVTQSFEAFAAPYRRPESAWSQTIEQAAWLNWSCVVGPSGHLKRDSMLMSNNRMTNIWSWDHAINALALARVHPDLAWDQLLTIFDHQLDSGQLPDYINDTVRLYSYVKPPIHGWILGRMLEANPALAERLPEIYEPLTKWTQWWCQHRLRDGLPVIYHGNDTGWDNATVFDAGVPATSCDIAAFLILQMEMLAKMADTLDQSAAAASWRTRAQEMLDQLVRQLWTGTQFRVCPMNPQSDSLFGALPLILGHRLPEEIRTQLVAKIRHHLTDWGLATEHPESPCYDADGYWRGPIWAPPTLILFEALRAIGAAELAQDVATRFCLLCDKSGFAENFDACTGAPLRDPAYTWTASVFLLMACKENRSPK